MFRWNRSNFNGFPCVYIKFNAKDLDTNALIEYRVQDLPEDRIDDALEFMTRDQFLREEPFMNGAGVKDDPIAFKEVKELMKKFLKEKVSLVCFKNGSEEIVGCNVLYVEECLDQHLSVPSNGEVMKKLLAVGQYMFDKGKPFHPKNIKFALKGFGLSVDQKYRRRRIAEKLLEARIPLLENIGLTTTITVFSGIGSQTAAKLAGFKEYVEVTYDELEANGHKLKDIKEYSAKTMGYHLLPENK